MTKFIAYKDTHQFAVIDPPESIRALALFLVYKELGEGPASHYSTEFNSIMARVIQMRTSGTFLDEYKKKNPRTWNENQSMEKDDAPSSLYWFFRGLEFEQGNPEEARKLFEKAQQRWEESEP